MHIGLILTAYLVLLFGCLAQVGKRSHGIPRRDIKNPVLVYGVISVITYFLSYYVSQSEADTSLFNFLNICMILAFWVFSLSILFFKFFFDRESKLFLRDVLVATLVLLAMVPVILWVKTMI